MNHTEAEILSKLRDIHLPPPITSWPLAVGWVILLVCIGLGGVIALFHYYKRRRFIRIQKWAIQRINEIRKDNSLAELSVLLKRIAFLKYPKEKVAHLYGENWLKFLAETSENHEQFSRIAVALEQGPYQKKVELTEPFFDEIIKWVRKNV